MAGTLKKNETYAMSPLSANCLSRIIDKTEGERLQPNHKN